MPWRERLDVSSFDPETVTVLARAIDDALQQLQRDEAFVVNDLEACRFALARHVIDVARTGERDPEKLVEEALFRFKF